MKHMDMKEFFASKRFRIAIGSLGAVIVMLASFAAGVAVGFHKAKYSYEWGNNYERNFVKGFASGRDDGRSGSRGGMMQGGGMMGGFGFSSGGDLRNAHGISGTILSVSGNAVVVTDRGGKENTVAIDGRTVIKDGRDTVSASSLTAGEQVVIVGNPGSTGVVNADLIRIVGTGVKADQNQVPTPPTQTPPPTVDSNTSNN